MAHLAQQVCTLRPDTHTSPIKPASHGSMGAIHWAPISMFSHWERRTTRQGREAADITGIRRARFDLRPAVTEFNVQQVVMPLCGNDGILVIRARKPFCLFPTKT